MVGDFAIGMLVGGGVPTMNLRIDYLRPAVGDYVDGVAVVRKAGKSAAVVDIDILCPAGAGGHRARHLCADHGLNFRKPTEPEGAEHAACTE